jgi:hypothetical protein
MHSAVLALILLFRFIRSPFRSTSRRAAAPRKSVSEYRLYAKLDLPHNPVYARNLSEGRGSATTNDGGCIGASSLLKRREAWVCVVCVIENVEEFRPELKVEALGDPGVLSQGRVERYRVRAKQRVSRQVAQFADWRRREAVRINVANSYGARIVGVNGRIVAAGRVGNIIGSVITNGPDVGGTVTKGCDVEGAASREIKDTANLPA